MAEAAADGIDSLVVMPPALQLKQKWLVTTVAKAEYLPVMDLSVVGGAGGGDFFFQVRRKQIENGRLKKSTSRLFFFKSLFFAFVYPCCVAFFSVFF